MLLLSDHVDAFWPERLDSFEGKPIRSITQGGDDLSAFEPEVSEADAHAILDRSLARGINFIDTAEIYAVPTRRETFGATETIIGH